MRVVVQRVSEASVRINGEVRGEIGLGFMILLGIEYGDDSQDVEWLCRKITNLRVFGDDQGLMNRSIKDVSGNSLVISQFTLHASTKKGNRPSFIRAAKPEHAIPLYEIFLEQLSEMIGCPVEKGEFGADMKVALINDGPVTLIIDSRNRE
ncbi:MAG TPA: D-tyrosyl-tRNA(Tyr) deacylase [Verrucomicrobiales bacterium]|nr:D-tyrosyl-tRNA(Tyr) deacylase [Verrucomicrobiales bacterium]HIL69588.1 D-tyrosyl-tRNA(Tyr) deacylase [Verrucomicrobiota bacterium]